MRIVTKNRLIGLAVGLTIFGGGMATSAAVAATSAPPQCVSTILHGNSGNGPNMYVKWCGTGSNGPSPMKSTVHNLTVDGGMLNRFCTKANPCVVLWP